MQSITNQKMLFAQSQLESFVSALEQAKIPREQLVARGFADACVYHLMSALRALLQEILSNYKVEGVSPMHTLGGEMIEDLLKGCEQEGIVIPELNYIAELSKKPQSSISQLHSLFAQAIGGGCVPDVTPSSSAGQIALRQVHATDPLTIQCQRLEVIIEDVKALVQHCRQTMQEY
ncbi:MAG: hypothetical protein KUG76_01560 [Gammaproteobacteria bacterium]|nr:hypothetical protein [Gammaproteobacteria bacterium]